ncbi:MAG: hypothetical protein ABI851_06600 [Saprospiraceae bacterium]
MFLIYVKPYNVIFNIYYFFIIDTIISLGLLFQSQLNPMKYSRNFLKKLEDISHDIGYKIRYEQGHFQAGYCRVEARKIIIINKFFDLEARINCFLDLLPNIPIDFENLKEETFQIYSKILDLRAQEELSS